MNEKHSFLDNPLFLAPTDYNTNASDDFSVLMNKRSLDEIAKTISERVLRPVTIIDANRIGTDVILSSIRANSSTEVFSLRYSCRLLRKCAGENICLECDHRHAFKFMEYLMVNDDEKKEPLPTETKCVDKIEENIRIFSVNGFNRFVAEYRCPMSGYRELMIPLYYEKETIIGILFIGQLVVKGAGDEIFVENTKRQFLDYGFKNYKSDLFADMSEKTIKRFKDNMINADNDMDKYESFLSDLNNASDKATSKNYTMSFSDKEQYYEFVESACRLLREIEENLTKTFNEKRQKYFEKKSRDIVNAYFENIKAERNKSKSDKESYSDLKTAWDSLLDATDRLKEEFNIQDIYIFGDGTSLAITDNKRKQLYSRNDATNTDRYYDYKTINTIDIQNNDYYTSFDKSYHDKLCEGLDEKINKSDHFIILFTNFVMVFCVKDFTKNKAIYKSMAQEIGKQFKKINTSIALETSTFMQEKQVKTLRMNRHENAHISSRITDRLEYDFADKGEAFLKLNPEKREFIIDDLHNSAKLLSNMAENIGVITGSITKENIKSKVRLVNVQDVLTKWQKMFRDILIDRNLNLELVRSYWDLWSMNIETVPSLFELLIYNIVDNAVKYAYRGTNVYISWDKAGGQNVFKVTNYGHEIKNTDKIYDLYVRGETHKSKRVEGDGIGL
ncbi:MAG: hypothetical protein MJ231_08790, partial [bacterium]|nr:hypothetical protein [bacterium]